MSLNKMMVAISGICNERYWKASMQGKCLAMMRHVHLPFSGVHTRDLCGAASPVWVVLGNWGGWWMLGSVAEVDQRVLAQLKV